MSDDPTPPANPPADPHGAAAAPAATAHASSASGALAAPAAGKRRRGLVILSLVVLVGAVLSGGYWLLVGRYYVSTDDAYVNGDLVDITSEEPGTVMVLRADDTQGVQQDQLLVELDPADAQIAMSNAEARLAEAVRAVRTRFATAAQLRALIADREVALQRAQADYARRIHLRQDGAVSVEELSHTQDEVAQIQADLTEAREQLRAATAQIDGTSVTTHPQVLAAEAAVRDAALALRRTRVLAPVAGVVARRSVQVGQQVETGTPLMAVVPLNDVWIDANFKEVQLSDMRVGQPVQLHSDIYGGDVTYHGRVVGLSAGSGNAFALLPAQNASGNWIKIVQRLPVRIALDPRELQAHPLRVGLSMTVKVDIRDRAGPLVAAQVRSVPIPILTSLAVDPAVQARIAHILAVNDGRATAVASLNQSR